MEEVSREEREGREEIGAGGGCYSGWLAPASAAEPMADGCRAQTDFAASRSSRETDPLFAAGREAERADFKAYLEQRADNAAAVARASAEGSDLRDMAVDRRRQCEVVIGDLVAGMHLGAAQVRAELLAAQTSGEA